jgi:hypothetical protein
MSVVECESCAQGGGKREVVVTEDIPSTTSSCWSTPFSTSSSAHAIISNKSCSRADAPAPAGASPSPEGPRLEVVQIFEQSLAARLLDRTQHVEALGGPPALRMVLRAPEARGQCAGLNAGEPLRGRLMRGAGEDLLPRPPKIGSQEAVLLGGGGSGSFVARSDVAKPELGAMWMFLRKPLDRRFVCSAGKDILPRFPEIGSQESIVAEQRRFSAAKRKPYNNLLTRHALSRLIPENVQITSMQNCEEIG